MSAYAEYTEDVSEHYDEVVDDVIARVEQERCLSKLDIAALTGWKRLQANTLWPWPWSAGAASTFRYRSAWSAVTTDRRGVASEGPCVVVRNVPTLG